MNTIALTGGAPKTMSSREIADYVGSAHDSVLKTIRNLIDRGVVSGDDTPYIHPQNGQTYREFLLDYRNTMVVVSGYSVEVRARIIDRWQELEAQSARPAELSRMDILKLAMESEQARIVAEEKLALAAPKVAYADAMTNADGTVLVRDAAKTLGVPVRKLEKALRDKGVILSDNAPASKYVTKGYFTESLNHYDTNTRGKQISRTARVTGRGLEFLRRFVDRHASLFSAARPARKAA